MQNSSVTGRNNRVSQLPKIYRIRKEAVMTKQDFLKKIPGIKSISVIFAQTTRMPMIFCHEETMDDFIYVYLKEEEALEKAKLLCEEKQPAVVVNCKEKEVLPFFAELRLTGVNAILFVLPPEQGGDRFMVQLTEFLQYPDHQSMPAGKKTVENASLHLSMLYFMQEARRPVAPGEKKNLAALEEETSANIARAAFLVPVKEDKSGEGSDKRAVMMLKNDKEEVFFPLFTDAAQLAKFMRGQKCPVMLLPFQVLAEMLKKGNATGIAINPTTSNVTLTKAGVIALEKRFLQ